MSDNEYTAPALTDRQVAAIQASLKDVARLTAKTSLSLNSQALLVQDMAYIHGLHTATTAFLSVVEDIPIPTMVRYAAKPDERSDDLHAMVLVDLDQYRAPTDLSGLEA